MTSNQDMRLRERRHNQLIHLISQYKLNEEEQDYLETVKKNTELQIAARYAKSKHNSSYKFPYQQQEEQDQEEESQERETSMTFHHSVYDLKKQNEIKQEEKTKQTEEKISKRVKSLGSEKFDSKALKDIRRQLIQRPVQRGSHRQKIVLPQLRLNPKNFRIQTKSEQKSKSARNSSKNLLKNRDLVLSRELISKQKKYNSPGDYLNAKLFAGEDKLKGQLISLGHTKIVINRLETVSPLKKSPKKVYKKLVTE